MVKLVDCKLHFSMISLTYLVEKLLISVYLIKSFSLWLLTFLKELFSKVLTWEQVARVLGAEGGKSTSILNIWHSLNSFVCRKPEFPSARPSVSQGSDGLS